MDRTRYRTKCRVKTVVRSNWAYLQVYTGGHDEVQGEDSGKSTWTYLLVSTSGRTRYRTRCRVKTVVRVPGRTCRLALVDRTRCKVKTVVRAPGHTCWLALVEG